MERIWMYKAEKTELYFRGELDKFIKVAEYKKWEDTMDTLPMQKMQEFESVQRSDHNQIACDGLWIC